MRRRERILPNVPIFHLLWGIPESFGGMTTVALQRASLLADTDRRHLDVLTLSPDLSPRTRQRELYLEGLISRRIRIRNLWDELRHASDHSLGRMSAGAPAGNHSDRERTPTAGHTDHVVADENGRELQVARFRTNGTLLLTDRQDVTAPGKRGGRRLTLYSRSGRAIGQWSSATSFYHAWLRFVTGANESVIICDSAFAGGLMHSFTSPRGSLIQVIHSHHHDKKNNSLGKLATGKLPILTNADSYDLVAVLTERQKRHLLEENIASDNVVAIPNPFHGNTGTSVEARPRERGIIVSRLSGIKRLDHAILALSSSASSLAPTLDIYGDGKKRDRLERYIADLSVGSRVHLHGHDPNARSQFARSSFSLLTSRTEGQSLMVVESMANGCIPIAYDIDYGPSDIITDGVDGFLVPAGRPDDLARAIDTFLDMDEERVADMREAALKTSKRFSSENIARKWADALHRVVGTDRDEHSQTHTTFSSRLLEVGIVRDHVDFAVQLVGLQPEAIAWAKLALVGRSKSGYMRLPLQISAGEHGATLRGELAIDQLALSPSDVVDLFVDARINDTRVRTRVGGGTAAEPSPIGISNLELYATTRGDASIRHPSDTTP